MTKLTRAILIALDGVGTGANPDAQSYGHEGASSAEAFGVGVLVAGTSFAHTVGL